MKYLIEVENHLSAFPPALNRAQRIEIMAECSAVAKVPVIGFLQGKGVEISAEDTIFPILVADMTEELVKQVQLIPGVLKVTPTGQFAIA